MKKISLILLGSFITLLSHAQQIQQQQSKEPPSQTSKYLPIEDKIVYKGKLLNFDANNKAVAIDVNDIPHDNTLIRLFPNVSSSVSIFSVDNNGSLTVAGNGGTVVKGTYHVIYEFSMFQPVNTTSGNTSITYCVGISVRLIANITTLKSSVDLSKIISLVSASGGTNKFSGQIQITMNGINSQTLTNLNPIPPNGATFTADNVATSLQSLAAIKSHFSDKDVNITPEVLGFYQTSNTAQDQFTYSKNLQIIKEAVK